MTTFWERKRAELAQRELADRPPAQAASAPSSGRPWWASGTAPVPVPAPDPEQPQRPAQSDGEIDGHDISRVTFLRGKAEQCPECPVNPNTGVAGNMYKASSAAAWRCFDCGYVQGREIHDISLPASAIMEGSASAARQVDQQGFQGNITSADQAIARLG